MTIFITLLAGIAIGWILCILNNANLIQECHSLLDSAVRKNQAAEDTYREAAVKYQEITELLDNDIRENGPLSPADLLKLVEITHRKDD